MGQIEMETACLDNPQPVGQSGYEYDKRIIEVRLEQWFNVEFEPAPLREIARFFQKFRFKFYRRLVNSAEHSLDRLHESGCAVFHARGEIEAACPGFAVSTATGAAVAGDKRQA